MALFDLPLDELRNYRPELDQPADFDEFWKAKLDEGMREFAHRRRYTRLTPEILAGIPPVDIALRAASRASKDGVAATSV